MTLDKIDVESKMNIQKIHNNFLNKKKSKKEKDKTEVKLIVQKVFCVCRL